MLRLYVMGSISFMGLVHMQSASSPKTFAISSQSVATSLASKSSTTSKCVKLVSPKLITTHGSQQQSQLSARWILRGDCSGDRRKRILQGCQVPSHPQRLFEGGHFKSASCCPREMPPTRSAHAGPIAPNAVSGKWGSGDSPLRKAVAPSWCNSAEVRSWFQGLQ